MEFEKFPSLTRFSQGWSVTEKLDGSNAQIAICPEPEDGPYNAHYPKGAIAVVDGMMIFAGSRNRWIGLGKEDHMALGHFVKENANELLKLGEGRHFGEWYGSGIQRGYGLTNGEKRFALFNSLRWKDNPDKPECCEVVHTFISNEYLDDHVATFAKIMDDLREKGSFHVPGFMNPEGIVCFHRASGVAFKKTFDYDEKGKWAENMEKKNA